MRVGRGALQNEGSASVGELKPHQSPPKLLNYKKAGRNLRAVPSRQSHRAALAPDGPVTDACDAASARDASFTALPPFELI